MALTEVVGLLRMAYLLLVLMVLYALASWKVLYAEAAWKVLNAEGVWKVLYAELARKVLYAEAAGVDGFARVLRPAGSPFTSLRRPPRLPRHREVLGRCG